MKKVFVWLGVLLLVLGEIRKADAQTAEPCPASPTMCQLPACRCSSTNIPSNLSPQQVPQIVLVTFDDPVNVMNYPLYEELLFNRKNPNGADISATFFVSHEYNDYSLTHQLWRRGHEIALQSITRNSNTMYWRNLNESGWTAEITEQRRQMSFLANIPLNDIKGMRAPFLQGGGNEMFRAIRSNLQWESSRPTYNFRQPGLWPYTNDYLSIQDCQIAPCLLLLMVPLIDNIGENGFPCSMFDSCQPAPTNESETFDLLKRNFDDQYTTNRAPFGLFAKSSWLQGPDPEYEERKKGYIRFLDYLDTLNDTYLVSVSQALAWIVKPTELDQITIDFAPWDPKPTAPDNCTFPRNCQYETKYMRACMARCPNNYPWLYNPLGE